MPRCGTGIDPSGYGERCPTTCAGLDILAAQQDGWTTQAGACACLLVGLDEDFLHFNRNPQFVREPLDGRNRLHAVRTITTPNNGDPWVTPALATPWCLDHVRPHRMSLRNQHAVTHRTVSHAFVCLDHATVRPTLRISCEAVPPSIPPAGAQGGTSACSTGAALSFVSCIRLLGGSVFLRLLVSVRIGWERSPHELA
jgi:hypothetical protein